MEYAIMIDGKYFKEYVYATENKFGRFGKLLIQDGDIVDIVLTDEVERTEVRRSLGGTIGILYSVDKMIGKGIEIIPVN